MSEKEQMRPPMLPNSWDASPRVICLADVREETVDFLWYPYIPYGKLTIVQGDPGGGKTTLVLRLAALLSKGCELPCDSRSQESIATLYQTAEDGLGDTIKPRLSAGGADCSRIFVIDETDIPLSALDARIEETIKEHNIHLVILDPLQAYLGNGVSMNQANEVRSVMSHLARIAERYRCAILLVGHLNKAQAGKSTYRGLGSIDFFAAARSVLLVGEDPQNEKVRVMIQQKSSLAPKGKPIAFELSEGNNFRWLGHYNITAEELLSGCPTAPKITKHDKACRIIRDTLSDGPHSQEEILSLAVEAGMSKRTLNEAKKSMGVTSRRHSDGRWFWQLDKGVDCTMQI